MRTSSSFAACSPASLMFAFLFAIGRWAQMGAAPGICDNGGPVCAGCDADAREHQCAGAAEAPRRAGKSGSGIESSRAAHHVPAVYRRQSKASICGLNSVHLEDCQSRPSSRMRLLSGIGAQLARPPERAVGLTNIQTVNSRFAIWNKAGQAAVNINSLWAGQRLAVFLERGGDGGALRRWPTGG